MLTRRSFLVALGAAGLGRLLRPVAGAAEAVEAVPGRGALPIDLLRSSQFVYVSPLKRDGGESRCHAEVWFGWIDDRVVMTVSRDGWKARAIDRGLDRARLWVGDHGRVRDVAGPDHPFRSAPSFSARGEKLQDPALLERLLQEYQRKYPEEIGRWLDRMRTGHAEGERVLIRYRPEA